MFWNVMKVLLFVSLIAVSYHLQKDLFLAVMLLILYLQSQIHKGNTEDLAKEAEWLKSQVIALQTDLRNLTNNVKIHTSTSWH